MHAQLRGRTVNKELWTFCRTMESRSRSVTAMLDFSGKTNTPIHGLGEDEAATIGPPCGLDYSRQAHDVVPMLLYCWQTLAQQTAL